MEKEVLELIRSFEGAAKKMENLDRTVSGFSQVLENLHEHLDELIEMVHLEDIVKLSEAGTKKLEQLKGNLDSMLLKAQLDGRYVYDLSDQLFGVDKFNPSPFAMEVAGPKKLVHAPIGVFALGDAGIFLLDGQNPALILEKPVADFAVYGNQLLYVSEGTLFRRHLLLNMEEAVMENVLSMDVLEPGNGVRVHQEAGQSVVFF